MEPGEGAECVATETSVVEDEVDQRLAARDGKIQRQRDPQL